MRTAISKKKKKELLISGFFKFIIGFGILMWGFSKDDYYHVFLAFYGFAVIGLAIFPDKGNWEIPNYSGRFPIHDTQLKQYYLSQNIVFAEIITNIRYEKHNELKIVASTGNVYCKNGQIANEFPLQDLEIRALKELNNKLGFKAFFEVTLEKEITHDFGDPAFLKPDYETIHYHLQFYEDEFELNDSIILAAMEVVRKLHNGVREELLRKYKEKKKKREPQWLFSFLKLTYPLILWYFIIKILS